MFLGIGLDLVAAEVGTRVATAHGPFHWRKGFGWTIGTRIFLLPLIGMMNMNALLVPFQQHKRQQPLPSPGPCWTFAPVTWSSPSAGPQRQWQGYLTLPSWQATRKPLPTCLTIASSGPCGDGQRIGSMRMIGRAGADFQGLVVKQLYEAGFAEETPFLQALFLDSLESKLEIWKEMIDRHLLPVCRELWRPSSDNRLGDLFWEERHGQGVFGKLSIDKIQACKNAGLDLLQFCNCRVTWRNVVTNSIDRSRRCVGATLLDMAILGGQVDCVEACVDGGVELQSDGATLAWHKGVMRGETPIEGVVPSEAQTAATAAGRAWLKRCWKSESSQKGIVLYQMVEKMFKGRSFPMALVQEILTFAMPVPTIIDQLDLWAHVNDWMTTIRGRPSPCGGLDGSGRELSFSVDWFVVDISAHILPSALKQCLFVRRQRHQNRIVFVPVVPGDITSCWTQDCFLPQWARHGVNAVYHEELFCCTSQITCVLCGLRFSWTTSTEIERIIL